MKNKCVKILIIVLLSAILAVCFSLCIFNLIRVLYPKQNNEIKADITKIIEINSKEDYVKFVNEFGENNTYAGTLIKLNCDIDFGGDDVDLGIMTKVTVDVVLGVEIKVPDAVPFEGVFDGQGHTLSNINIEEKNHQHLDINPQGLFLKNAGTIKNLKIKNLYMYIGDEKLTYAVDAGAIAGINTGIIESCWVENVKFYSGKYKMNCYVGGIVGYNNGTVKNCIVSGLYEIGGETEYLVGNNDGLHAGYFVAEGVQATYCLFSATVLEFDVTTDLVSPDERDNAFREECKNANSTSTAKTILENDKQLSSIGGLEEVCPWYYSETYNNEKNLGGWPILRCFLSWKEVSFNITNAEITPESIQIPSDANQTFSGTTEEICIYDQIIFIEPTSEHYSSIKWNFNGDNISYDVVVDKPKITITIRFLKKINNNSANDVQEIIKTYSDIECGSVVYINYNTKYIKFQVGNNSEVNRNIDNAFYISDVDFRHGTEAHGNTIITVTLHPKKFGIEFK